MLKDMAKRATLAVVSVVTMEITIGVLRGLHVKEKIADALDEILNGEERD